VAETANVTAAAPTPTATRKNGDVISLASCARSGRLVNGRLTEDSALQAALRQPALYLAEDLPATLFGLEERRTVEAHLLAALHKLPTPDLHDACAQGVAMTQTACGRPLPALIQIAQSPRRKQCRAQRQTEPHYQTRQNRQDALGELVHSYPPPPWWPRFQIVPTTRSAAAGRKIRTANIDTNNSISFTAPSFQHGAASPALPYGAPAGK
jgi:hypothetical protein